ncbi:MAG TPA: hypothetical protein VLJ84_10165 [Usitatibacter sp.]|nr:hypothetical protein [Usitatibacter sp.]
MEFGPARPRVEPAGAEKLGNEVRWVAVSPAYYEVARRRVKSTLWVVPGLLALMAALLYFVFGIAVLEDAKVRVQLIFTVVVMLAAVAMTPFTSRRALDRLRQYRLGASNAGLAYEMPKDRLGAGGAGRTPWRDVCFDGKFILAGRKQLRVRLPPKGEWMFDPEELRRAILVHIPKDNLLTPGQLQMRMAGPWTWLLVAGIAAVVAWALFALNVIPGRP